MKSVWVTCLCRVDLVVLQPPPFERATLSSGVCMYRRVNTSMLLWALVNKFGNSV